MLQSANFASRVGGRSDLGEVAHDSLAADPILAPWPNIGATGLGEADVAFLHLLICDCVEGSKLVVLRWFCIFGGMGGAWLTCVGGKVGDHLHRSCSRQRAALARLGRHRVLLRACQR
jgi:hypothetical protein